MSEDSGPGRTAATSTDPRLADAVPATGERRGVTDETPERDPEEVARFVERFAASLTEAGMARMPARVFAALLTTDSGRLTSAELSETLQVSPAAVSGAVRYLSQVNMATREREPGSRRDVYRVGDDLWYEMFGRRDTLMLRLENAVADGVGVLRAGTPAGDRMAETLDFFSYLRQELPEVMRRWRTTREQQARRGAG